MLADWFLWLKALHVISVIAWMAGLFYLPRLFVYHCRWQPGDEAYAMFVLMERRLAKVIMRPAAVLSWLFGLLTAAGGGYFTALPGWFVGKLLLVVAMTVFQWILELRRRDFAIGQNRVTERYFRLMNEVPTGLMVGIVVLVVVRPFG